MLQFDANANVDASMNEALLSIISLGVVTAVNCINVKLAARGQTFTTCTSILSLILITILGFVHMANEGKFHEYLSLVLLTALYCSDGDGRYEYLATHKSYCVG